MRAIKLGILWWVGCLIIGLSIISINRQSARKELQAEAVDAGVAEWVVIDAKGNTEFRWKKPPQEDEEAIYTWDTDGSLKATKTPFNGEVDWDAVTGGDR